MNDKKQIEEMSEIFRYEDCVDVGITECRKFDDCNVCKATRLYDAGYHKQEWISVEERLPKNKGDYMVFTKNGNMKVMPFFIERNASAAVYGRGFCEWMRGARTNDDDWWKPVEYVTHWMPLPEPPKGGAE